MKKGFLQKKLAIDRFITFYFRFLQEINIISPMRKLIVFFSFWFSVTIVVAQNTERKLYSIAFYNLENLFDTIHDAGKNDYDFLPDGSYRWTAKKYEAKLHNLSDVLSALSRNLVPEGPAVIGVAEVENHRVLTDLVSQPAMANYKFVHYEGPDRRGIDCALLYDPQQFAVTNSKLVLSAPFEGDTVHLTRGFLIVDGRMAGERVCFIVNHWPSRGAKSPVRVHAARQVKALTDSLMHEDKKLKLFVMGDMNDDPMDESMQTLGARKYISGMKANQFFNPWWEILEDKGVGTLLYRGKWNLFDQIVLSRPLVKAKKGLRYDHSEVFIRDYLIQQDGKYKGSPLRTHGGRVWLNGYSDHLPMTRGFLIVDGRMAGERVCFIVNHWPSRGAKSPVRVHAARQVKALTDSLMHEDKKLKLFVMGDMNDDPMDESMQTLGARKYISGMKANQFFNPWWEILEDKGVGTLLYRGKWNLFDQIVLSRPLVKAKKGLRYDHSEVFIRDYLIQQDGKYKGSPLRTHGGRVWLNGYSDHLPTIIYLKR